MGFGGLLKLPHIVNNKEFSHWVLSRVSIEDVAIRLGDGSLLPFTEDDVYKVLHIPCTGKELRLPSTDQIASIKQIICKWLKVADYKNINGELLDDILSKKYVSPMSDDDIEAFKTAFLLLVMTKFLAPQALLDNICPRYFAALRDLDDIPNWNWARYVIQNIISAARALGNKLNDETRCSYINGCVIFLQVFYLDNIGFGHLNMKHNLFPRIVDYGREAIKARMNLDIIEKDPYKPTHCEKEVMYVITYLQREPIQHHHLTVFLVIRVVQHVGLLVREDNTGGSPVLSCRVKIQVLTDGNTFTWPTRIGATTQDHNQQSSGHSENQTINIPHSAGQKSDTTSTSVTPIITKPVAAQKNYSDSKASIDLNRSVHQERGTSSNRKTANAPPLLIDLEAPSLDLGFDLTPEKEKSRIAQIVASDSKASIDLNRSVHHEQAAGASTYSLSPRSISREVAAASCIVLEDMFFKNSNGELKNVRGIKREYPEPRLLDFGLSTQNNTQRQRRNTSASFDCPTATRARPEHISSVLLGWIKNCQSTDTLRSTWVAHPYPTPVKLTGVDIRDFIEGNNKVDYPTMMIYTRRILQLEYEKFGKTAAYGSRHFLEADFVVHAIAGDSLWNPEMFRNQFTGPKILYNVSKCENIYVQFCDVNHWECYAFNLHEEVIHILDSSKSSNHEGVHPGSKHHWIVPMLARAMQECLALFFADWSGYVTKWEYKQPVVPTQSFEVESGVYTLELMKNWNGTECTKLLNPGCIDAVRTGIVMDILSIKENVAELPSFVQELMKQYI